MGEVLRYHIVTAATDKEWPLDHPFREGALNMHREEAETIADVVICQIEGELRIPAEPPDADIAGRCSVCKRGIVFRLSAPLKPKVCWYCWREGKWP